MAGFPLLLQHTEADSEESFTTKGWISKAYKLDNSPLRFLKKTLYLSEDLFLTEVNLQEGRFRNVAEIAPERMTIGFYHKKGSYSVTGNDVQDYVISLAYNGSKWDVTADAPGFSQSIHLSPLAVKSIVRPDIHGLLMDRLKRPDGLHSIAFPMTAIGEALRKSIEGCFQLVERDELSLAELEWTTSDLVTHVACLIDELTSIDNYLSPTGRRNRRLIALEIEDLLWKKSDDSETLPSSIDDFAAHFSCSRRHIQQSIEETFGIGFAALKRYIRLQQAYAILHSGNFTGKVTRLASDHDFNHIGRFARYFKDMFGQQPSSTIRQHKRRPRR